MSKFVDDDVPALFEDIVQMYWVKAAWSVIQRFDTRCSVRHDGNGADLEGDWDNVVYGAWLNSGGALWTASPPLCRSGMLTCFWVTKLHRNLSDDLDAFDIRTCDSRCDMEKWKFSKLKNVQNEIATQLGMYCVLEQ